MAKVKRTAKKMPSKDRINKSGHSMNPGLSRSVAVIRLFTACFLYSPGRASPEGLKGGLAQRAVLYSPGNLPGRGLTRRGTGSASVGHYPKHGCE